MKKLIVVLVILNCLTGFAQSVESITEMISNKMCDCMKDDFSDYSEVKAEYNRCYDEEFNFIFNYVTPEEHKLLVQPGVLQQVKEGLVMQLNMSCDKIIKFNENDMEGTVNEASQSEAEPCPTNFDSKDLRKLKKLDGEIVAFNAIVTEVHIGYKGKPYYQVKLEGGKTIWIASLVRSGFEKEGKMLRLLGYVSAVSDDELAGRYNDEDFHILVFCAVDLESQQMAMLPGSEQQVKEWVNGTIPLAVESQDD